MAVRSTGSASADEGYAIRTAIALAASDDGYATADEELGEEPAELPTRRAPSSDDGPLRRMPARQRAASAMDLTTATGRHEVNRHAHSWHGVEPGIFSEGSFVRSSDESKLFRSPRARIIAWLSAREHDLSPAETQNEKDLMYLLLENRSFGYPGTDGTLLSNYMAYVLNRHPLISIVTAHPLHPFTRAERVAVLVCSFCWAFFVKAVMHRDPLINQPWWVFYTVVALLVLPYEVLIRVFAVCSCVQYDESESGFRRRRAWICAGRAVLGVLTIFNVAFITYGVWTTVHIDRVKPYSLLRQSWSTLVVKLWALAVWFPSWLPIFLLFYNSHKQTWLEAHPPNHPCHVAAVSTEDRGASVIYWLLVAHTPRPPSQPRISKRFSTGAITTLPIVDVPSRTLRMPVVRRSSSPELHRTSSPPPQKKAWSYPLGRGAAVCAAVSLPGHLYAEDFSAAPNASLPGHLYAGDISATASPPTLPDTAVRRAVPDIPLARFLAPPTRVPILPTRFSNAQAGGDNSTPEDDGELGSRPFPPRRQAGVSNGWSCRSPGISSATRSSAVLGAACASAPGALYGDSGVWPAAAQPSIQSQRSSLVGGSAALPPFRSSTRDAGREMV
mmetsp:Transcript_4314/g.11038  ORF Transcript_4314/g.11038 Transcript_4314/m.11038 type:complete len:614 (+) Transcript_4314:244-2085(+)